MVLLLLLAVIGGIIGWITNVLAIKLMFRPLVPIKIPIFNIEIVGLIPKRKSEIAKTIGEVIQAELISIEDITANLITEQDKDRITEFINIKIQNIINEKMSFIPSPIKAMAQGYIKDIIDVEIKKCIDELSEEMIHKANQRINIQEIVEEKVNEFDLEKLEEIIISVCKKELKHIEILGLILGFIIGLIQGLVVILLK